MIGIGSSVGHYVVRAKIGEGAMGTVYLGHHHVLESRVAIKVIRGGTERTEEDVSRFFTEARAATRIGHENIVNVLDFGRTPDGDPYYIMELLTGESLAARLTRGRRPLAEVLHVVGQVAAALAESHAKGIVHRDLKPGNVYLVRRGQDAMFVKLLDFGVAKLTEEEAEDRGHRTNTGRLLGTPHYMAPEQVAGRRAIDGRADVYALGVMLFEMVCGRLPFDAPKWTEVLIQHVTQTPPRARELDPTCPPWLDELIDRALAKTPQERPGMASVRDALRRSGGSVARAASEPDGAREDAERYDAADAAGALATQAMMAETLLEGSSPPPATTGPTPSRPPELLSRDPVMIAGAETMASSDPRVAGEANAKLAWRQRKRTLVAAAVGVGVGVGALGALFAGFGTADPPAVARAGRVAGAAAPTGRRVTGFDDMRKRMEDARDQISSRSSAAGEAEPAPSAPRPAPTTPPAPRAATPARPVPPPAFLDGFDVEKALSSTRAAVADCNARYAGVLGIDVTIVVAGSGDVQDVRVGSDYIGTPFAMCLLRVIRDTARFPVFTSAEQEVTFSYGFGVEPIEE